MTPGTDSTAPASQSANPPFICDLQIRWSDQDLNGHVNNARIITLVEEARVRAAQQWLNSLPHQKSPRVVRSLTIDFTQALLYGLDVEAHVWISRIGTTSYVVSHQLHQNEQSCARCDAVIVQLDPHTGKPVPLDAELREALERALIS